MDFESHIQGNKPVLAEYYADWCELCKSMTPVLHEVKGWTGERLLVLRINIDENKAFANDYQVFAVPTLILFKHGRILWRKNGIASAHEILEHLNLLME